MKGNSMTDIQMFEQLDEELHIHYKNIKSFIETQPMVSLKESRSLLAKAVALVFEWKEIKIPKKGGLADRINLIAWDRHISNDTEEAMSRIRISGNKASHSENKQYANVDWVAECRALIDDIICVGKELYQIRHKRVPELTKESSAGATIKELLYNAVVYGSDEDYYLVGKEFAEMYRANNSNALNGYSSKAFNDCVRYNELAKLYLSKAPTYNADAIYLNAHFTEDRQAAIEAVKKAASMGHDQAIMDNIDHMLIHQPTLSNEEVRHIIHHYNERKKRFNNGEISLAGFLIKCSTVLHHRNLLKMNYKETVAFITQGAEYGDEDAIVQLAELNIERALGKNNQYDSEEALELIDGMEPRLRSIMGVNNLRSINTYWRAFNNGLFSDPISPEALLEHMCTLVIQTKDIKNEGFVDLDTIVKFATSSAHFNGSDSYLPVCNLIHILNRFSDKQAAVKKYTDRFQRLLKNNGYSDEFISERLYSDNSIPAVHERAVNKNMPCPCGSGKKLRKCCVDAKAAPVLAYPQTAPLAAAPLRKIF